MFVYEKDNSINIAFNSSKPVEAPDAVIKGFQNGAALIIDGTTYGINDGVEFDGKAKTLVYQKDAKLMITFRGIEGMNDPEVTVDEVSSNVFDVVVSGQALTVSVVDGAIVVGDSASVVETKADEPVAPVKEEEPEEVVEEEDSTEVSEEEPEEEVVEE